MNIQTARLFAVLMLVPTVGVVTQTLSAQGRSQTKAGAVKKKQDTLSVRGGGTSRNLQYNRYKVTTVSTWNAGMEIVATIDDGIMSADARGHFTGTANVKWRTSLIGSASCGAGENRTAPSTAALAGDIDGSGQLAVTITFAARDFSGWAMCGPVSVSTSNLATPAPLTLTVAPTGGDSTQGHSVTAKNGSFAGSATIVVTPETNL